MVRSLPRLAIVTPVFNESACLPAYVDSVRRLLLDRGDVDARVIFVDDGSTDDSWAIIEGVCAADRRFSAIRLSRNWGSHIAITAGIDACGDADAVCTLACDLQDPPETILAFLDEWRAGAQIVWGKRKTRQDKKWKIVASNIFTNLLKRSGLPRDSQFCTGSFLLLDKQAAAAFRQFGERNRITFALVAWTGFRQRTVEYDRGARIAGTSGWSVSRMFKAMYDAFVGFSPLPVRLITALGLTFFLVDIVASLYLTISWLLGNPLQGWTSIMVLQLFLFGVLFFILGIMGEYLSRIYTEVAGRPLYLVQKKLNMDTQPDDAD